MAFWDWLKQVAGSFSSGWNWLKQTVRPVTDFLRQVPVVGGIMRDMDPLTNLVDKVSDSAGQFSRNEQVTSMPGIADVAHAARSTVGTYKNLTNAPLNTVIGQATSRALGPAKRAIKSAMVG